jgi:hypothetical protein
VGGAHAPDPTALAAHAGKLANCSVLQHSGGQLGCVGLLIKGKEGREKLACFLHRALPRHTKERSKGLRVLGGEMAHTTYDTDGFGVGTT